MKNALFIVYYFPPMGGSGVQRPLKFVKYLPEFGWNPIVLCPEPGMYHTFDESLTKELDETGIEIHRVTGNTPLHMSKTKQVKIPGFVENTLRKVSAFFWLPDNKKGWIKPGLEKALEIIASKRIDLIYATAAPYSNLQLAAALGKETSIKVVMDLRDEWLESHLINYPTRWHFNKMKSIESETLNAADLITVINESYQESFSRRFPHKEIKVVTHGFDPEDFESSTITRKEDKKVRILYSGLFYGERTPALFLRAFSELRKEHPDLMAHVELQFQGGLGESVKDEISNLGLSESVRDFGYVTHKKAVEHLQQADALWLMIGHLSHAQNVTVGKMFEYFGARKPILGLVPDGVSQSMLQEYGAAYLAHPTDFEAIKNSLFTLINDLSNGNIPAVNDGFVEGFDRKQITKKLAQILTVISA